MAFPHHWRSSGRRIIAAAMIATAGIAGARLEGSKEWMKDFLVSAGVATARHAVAEGKLDAMQKTQVELLIEMRSRRGNP